jgi:hypothetical protein
MTTTTNLDDIFLSDPAPASPARGREGCSSAHC